MHVGRVQDLVPSLRHGPNPRLHRQRHQKCQSLCLCLCSSSPSRNTWACVNLAVRHRLSLCERRQPPASVSRRQVRLSPLGWLGWLRLRSLGIARRRSGVCTGHPVARSPGRPGRHRMHCCWVTDGTVHGPPSLPLPLCRLASSQPGERCSARSRLAPSLWNRSADVPGMSRTGWRIGRWQKNRRSRIFPRCTLPSTQAAVT